MSTKTIVRAEDVHEGDKITLTYTYKGAEITVTGPAYKSSLNSELYVGGAWVDRAGRRIERHAPEWQSARVVEAGGRLFGKGDEGSYDPWVEIRTEKRAVRGGLAWFTDQAVAEAAGDTSPKIIVQR